MRGSNPQPFCFLFFHFFTVIRKMIRFSILLLSLFFLSLPGLTPAQAAPRTIYLSARTDGLPGSGTPSDPTNVSTAARFDAFWAAQHTQATKVSGGVDQAVFNLAAGNYSTMTGITVFSGWSLIGAGQSSTTISLISSSPEKMHVISDGYLQSTNITVENMTVDGGVTSTLSTSLTKGFNIPAAGKTVTISVRKSSLFTVNGYAYLQGPADAAGFMASYGVFTVTGIPNGTSITLRNDSPSGMGTVDFPAASRAVPSGVSVILPYHRVGLCLTYKNITVQNVTIQNVMNVVYEGESGIQIGADGTHNGVNNHITDCTLKGIYGTYAWGIYLTGAVNSKIAWAQCDITGCTVIGGGWYQGIGGYQMKNCTFSGNHISDFPECFYVDSGSNSNITITNNVFVGSPEYGYGVICFNGDPISNSLFSGNTITSNNNQADIFLAGNVSNNTFSNNQLLGTGFPLSMGNVKTGEVMKGNYFSNNIIGTATPGCCIVSSSYGSELGNVAQGSNKLILLGLTNLNGSKVQASGSTPGGQSSTPGTSTPGSTASGTTSSSKPTSSSSTTSTSKPSPSSSTSSSSGTSSGNASPPPPGYSPPGSSSPAGTTASSSSTVSTIWLAARTDGISGSGTQSDPIDVSTAAKFDAFFAKRYAAHFSNYSSYDPMTFQFLPGSYSCSGINAMSGWHLSGSDQSTTVINVTAASYASDSTKFLTPTQGIWCSYGARDIQVKNLTLDGGVRATGIPLSSSFSMPGPRGTVEVTVSNPAQVSLGKWYYLQDTAMTNGIQKWWGILTCTAINGNTVTLQNAEVAKTGTVTGDITSGSPLVRNLSSTANLEEGQTIDSSAFAGGSASIASVDTSTQIRMTANATTTANRVTLTYSPYLTNNGTGEITITARLFPAGSRSGITLQSNAIQIENVTVQDVSMPLGEGPGGIGIINSTVNQTSGSGNSIDDCTVKDMFGIYGDYISAENSGTNGVTEEVNIANNTVLGNGYSKAIVMTGISNSAVSGNTLSKVNTGLYCDSGDSAEDTISANSFSGVNGIYLGAVDPAYFTDGTIKNNVISLTSTDGTGIRLTFNTSNVTISDNIITIESGGDGSHGIMLSDLNAAPSSNKITDNQIAPSLTNKGIDAGTNQILSSDQPPPPPPPPGGSTPINAQTGISLQAHTAASLRTDPDSVTPGSTPLISAATPAVAALISSPPAPGPASTPTGRTMASASPPPPGAALDPAENALVQRLTRDVALMESLSSGPTFSPPAGTSATGPGGKMDPSLASSELQQKKLLAELNFLIHQIQEENNK
jgi:hypothetical protein